MDLTLYHAEISQVLQIIHHLFNIEGAVFDDSAVLVTGSKGYLERKGTAVHKPSIMEVIENDEVIVLRPGEMRSCIGCRFSGNCPATLELLKRIVIDGTPVRVLRERARPHRRADGLLRAHHGRFFRPSGHAH